MILILALSLLATDPGAELPMPSEQDREIIVIGEKLAKWRGLFKERKGEFSCKTKRSTGDKMIDKIGCDALIQCAAPRSAEVSAIYAANKDKQIREQLLKPINESIGACLFQTRNDAIAALAEQRTVDASK